MHKREFVVWNLISFKQPNLISIMELEKGGTFGIFFDHHSFTFNKVGAGSISGSIGKLNQLLEAMLAGKSSTEIHQTPGSNMRRTRLRRAKKSISFF